MRRWRTRVRETREHLAFSLSLSVRGATFFGRPRRTMREKVRATDISVPTSRKKEKKKKENVTFPNRERRRYTLLILPRFV